MLANKQSQLRIKPLFFASFFIIWVIIVTITRYHISTFILTLLGLIIMWIPLIIKIPLPDKLTLSRFYCRGLALSFIVSYIELFLSLFFQKTIVDIIPFIAHKSVGNLSDSLNISIDRISSLMTEPSEYAVFLVFGYICLDYLNNQKSINSNTLILMKLNIALLLLLTFSVSGIILFILYLFLSSTYLLFAKNKMKTLFKTILIIFITTMVLFTFTQTIPELEIASASFINRITSFLEMTNTDNLNTSEGSRSASMKIAVDSLSDDYGFVGQGFGTNLSDWIVKNYPNTLYSRQSKGEIYNTYAAVIIGVGIPGLLAFIGTIYESFNSSSNVNFYQKTFFLVWLGLGFFIGSLLYYSYWGILYLVATQEIYQGGQKSY